MPQRSRSRDVVILVGRRSGEQNNYSSATSLNGALLHDKQVGVGINNEIKIIVFSSFLVSPTLVHERDSVRVCVCACV